MAKLTIPGAGLWSTIAALLNSNTDELYYKAGTGWFDILGNLSNATAPGAGLVAPDWVKIADNGAGSSGVWGRGFDPSSEEDLIVPLHIPHGILDEIIYPHVHWSPSNTNTGTVRWGLEWSYAKGYNQETFPTTTITYIEQAAPGVVGRHMIAEVVDPGITVAGLETDGLILTRLFRDATHPNDTFTGDAIATFMDAHVQVDRMATPNRNFPFD